jgi:hypothetical protein
MIKDEEIELMIEDCAKREHKLNPWEKDFIQNLSEKEYVTDRQIEVLEEIWEKIT